MLAFTTALKVAALPLLAFASPLGARDRSRTSFAVPITARASMTIKSASEWIFDKDKALAEKARIVKKYAINGVHSANSTRRARRATSGKVALTDDYDGLDECAYMSSLSRTLPHLFPCVPHSVLRTNLRGDPASGTSHPTMAYCC